MSLDANLGRTSRLLHERHLGTRLPEDRPHRLVRHADLAGDLAQRAPLPGQEGDQAHAITLELARTR